MTWLSAFFSLHSLLIAIVYALALLLGYRLWGGRGIGLAAGGAFLVLGGRQAYVLSAVGGSVPVWLYLTGVAGLLGHLLPPALLVHRVSRRNPEAYPWATIAGVAGYFVGGLIVTGVLAVVVIIVASSRL